MDRVTIRRLSVDTVIGIYDWEKQIRQTVVLDIDMAWDNRPAASSDHIDDALDYFSVSKRLQTFIESSQFGLIETLAERCASIILQEFSVPWVRIALDKPGAVPEAQSVGVVIERGVIPGVEMSSGEP
ncbi:Dihydroneopterin aldolase [BD1-7 clade bacterium]|uniref:7,8-dihydroneopterin aldolase n=1 Tax=BD1-7 clade bacterium TaxID=2029982 RepID=A0A5S9QZ44_9GAMM|nr:Dihydroneopterin aldolase [BD1-7 clade bacterium]